MFIIHKISDYTLQLLTIIFILLFLSTHIVISIQINADKILIQNNLENHDGTNYDVYNDIQDIKNKIDEKTLNNYLIKLTDDFKGRTTGSDICKDAGNWIYTEFKKIQTLQVSKFYWKERAPISDGFKRVECFNIIAELPSYSENNNGVIILSAHYDCDKNNSPGALDNGCGIASLLSVAHAISHYQYNYTFRFIAYSGEEMQFLGSYAYAREMYEHNERIAAVINMDVIGNNIYFTDRPHQLRVYTISTLEPLISVFNDINVENDINIQLEKRNYVGNSDDKPFNDYGYPSLQLFQSGNRMESFYGQENDTIDLVNFTYLKCISWTVAAGLYHLGKSNLIVPKIYIDNPKENALYIKNTKINTLLNLKGRTIAILPLFIQVEPFYDFGGDIEKVIFQLISGFSEYKTSNDPHTMLLEYTDDSYPYQWTLSTSCFGKFTIRANAIDKNNKISIDEIEVFMIGI